jgi:hypothetical protein
MIEHANVLMKHAEEEYRTWIEDRMVNFKRGVLSCKYLNRDQLESITRENQSSSFARLRDTNTDAKTSIYVKGERELQAKWSKKVMPILFDCWQNRSGSEWWSSDENVRGKMANWEKKQLEAVGGVIFKDKKASANRKAL